MLSETIETQKEYTLYNFIYMKFEKKQNYCKQIHGSPWDGGKESAEKEQKGTILAYGNVLDLDCGYSLGGGYVTIYIR